MTPPVRKVVLDTSLFVNPDVRFSLGATPTEALGNFLELARQAKSLEFYMPPSAFQELMNFVNEKQISGDFFLHMRQRPPKKHEIQVPGYLLYELIEEMRDRVNKGLRIAETGVRGTEKRTVDDIVQDVRKKYREALREGIIDSKEDVDILLLARELDALLITADQGLVKWAEKLGIAWLLPERFRDFVIAAIEQPGTSPEIL